MDWTSQKGFWYELFLKELKQYYYDLYIQPAQQNQCLYQDLTLYFESEKSFFKINDVIADGNCGFYALHYLNVFDYHSLPEHYIILKNLNNSPTHSFLANNFVSYFIL